MADLQFPGIARGFQHADLSLGVAEDDSLSDGECIIQVAQCVELPLLSLHCHKELLDALQRQLITETSENPFSIAQIGQKQCTEEKLVFCVGIQHVGHHTDSEFYMTALHLSQKCVKKKLFKKGGGGACFSLPNYCTVWLSIRVQNAIKEQIKQKYSTDIILAKQKALSNISESFFSQHNLELTSSGVFSAAEIEEN